MGKSSDFVIKEGVLKKYVGLGGEVIIPNEVIEIGESAFENYKNPISVIIPDSVIRIENNAFFFCEGLTSIVIPGSVINIGNFAFTSCKNLVSVEILDGVIRIGTGAFSFCDKLFSVTIPNSVREIEERVFWGCKKLHQISISNWETVHLAEGVFMGCVNLVDKDGFFILQNRLFVYHTEKKEADIIIPETVTVIEKDWNWENKKVHLEMPMHCPFWETSGIAKKHGFVNSVIKQHGSTISFRNEEGKIAARIVLAIEGETEPKQIGAMLAIRQKDGKFDFECYDTYFTSLGKAINKIRIALVRIEYPYELSEEMQEIYLSFLKKQSIQAGKLLIDEHRTDLLQLLTQKQILSKTSLPKLMEYAKENGNVEQIELLQSYQHTLSQKTTEKKADSSKTKAKEKSFKQKSKTNNPLLFEYIEEERDVLNDTDFLASTVEVAEIDFPTSIFVLSDFKQEEDVYDIKMNLMQRGSVIEEEVCEKINYLILPDGDIAKSEKYKEAEELQKQGSSIAMIRWSECKKHFLLYDEKVFGTEGAKQLENYRISINDGEIYLKEYIGKETNILVPKQIGEYPVTRIEEACFAGFKRYMETPCPELRHIVIQDNITELPAKVFRHCKKLISVELPQGLTVIGEKAFEFCENLIQINLPNSLVRIDREVFRSCKNLAEITIPDSVVTIGKYAFESCEKLSSIYIPASVQSIDLPFVLCNHLTEIIVDEKNPVYHSKGNCNAVIETASNTLVMGCKATKISEEQHITSIGKCAFEGVDITDFILPEGIIEIGDSAFGGCHKLENISLPSTLEKISPYAFQRCSSLAKISLPKNVSRLGNYAFFRCDNMEEVTLYEKITNIDKSVFFGCNLKKVYGTKNSFAKQIAESKKIEYLLLED